MECSEHSLHRSGDHIHFLLLDNELHKCPILVKLQGNTSTQKQMFKMNVNVKFTSPWGEKLLFQKQVQAQILQGFCQYAVPIREVLDARGRLSDVLLWFAVFGFFYFYFYFIDSTKHKYNHKHARACACACVVPVHTYFFLYLC